MLTETNSSVVPKRLLSFQRSTVQEKENKKSVVPKIVVETFKKLMETAVRALPFVLAKAKEYSWKELQDIEDRCRNVLHRDTLGFWEVLLSWD